MVAAAASSKRKRVNRGPARRATVAEGWPTR